jgi:hypothetical protein
MPLSEEWLDSVYSKKVRENSITSSDLPFPNSWREDSKPLLPRESSPTQFITLEFSSDKDTSQLESNLLTSQATWLELAVNNISNWLHHQSTRLVRWEEPRRRSPRNPLLPLKKMIETVDESSF